MCFQWLLHIFLDRARRNNDTRRIAVVHERNDYKEIALRVFGYMSQKDDPDGLLMSMSFGDKISFPPLQAADCLAYETFRRLKNPDGKERRALTALAVDGSYLRIATYSEARGNIQRLIRMLDEMRQAHEEGRLADAARFED
jgi:hypothetical protein